ncbi:hypothetical protein PENTCL1PPCAC_10893, partial [Pristionchus entomophagus]
LPVRNSEVSMLGQKRSQQGSEIREPTIDDERRKLKKKKKMNESLTFGPNLFGNEDFDYLSRCPHLCLVEVFKHLERPEKATGSSTS